MNVITNEQLGQGSFSTVFFGVWNNQPAAIKKINPDFLTTHKGQLKNEFRIQKELNHENIVKMFDVGKNETTLYFILEWMEFGNLHGLLYTIKITFDSEQYILIANDIANGLNYIHEHHFLHRDIKAENILLNGKMQAKIADFGGVIAFENKNLAVIDSYLVGTAFYCSPEMALLLLNNAPQYEYGTWTDIYAFGITLLDMVCAPKNVYNAETLNKLYKMIINAQYRQPPPETAKTLKNIISNCLIKDLTHRITIEDILAALSAEACINNPKDIRTALQLKITNSGHAFFHPKETFPALANDYSEQNEEKNPELANDYSEKNEGQCPELANDYPEQVVQHCQCNII